MRDGYCCRLSDPLLKLFWAFIYTRYRLKGRTGMRIRTGTGTGTGTGLGLGLRLSKMVS